MLPVWLRTSLAAFAGVSLLTAAAVLPGTPPLAGRVIVIDPGHGGKGDTGAVARSGLKEAHVNLMVGLRLAEMLRRDGAQVLLTRTGDTFVASDDAVSDLAARAQVANDANADLFLSIHHNDTLSAGDPKNDTQVYWKLDDQGPSRDFATLLLPRLAQSLHMPRQQLLAGNFAVLRRNERPAILGEGGYLSNPVTAQALSQPATWQKEAEAYASAIRTYFSRGVPKFGDLRWEKAGTDTAVQVATTGSQTLPQPERLVVPVDPDGSPLTTVSVLVDGAAVPAVWDRERNQIVWNPEKPLGNGKHLLRAEARNEAGNAALALNSAITVDRPPARIEAMSVPGGWQPEASPVAIVQAAVFDAVGLPVADGTPVTVAWADQTQTVPTRAGHVVTSLPWPADARVPVRITAGTITAEQRFDTPTRTTHLALTLQGSGTDEPAATVSLDGQPLPPFTAGSLGVYDVPAGPHVLSVQAKGYEPWDTIVTPPEGTVTAVTASLTPRFGGVLMGRRIMLDPFAQSDHPQVAPRTLALANALKERLEAAGAVVNLSRTDGLAVAPDERCRQMTQAGCELYVGLDVGAGDVAHYYTSVKGSKIARLIVAQQKGFHPSPEATYMVTHSPCTAVVVRARSTDDGVAAGLFEALRRYYAP